MSQPFVSVVTPFHNTAPYLAQCIESVLAQTYAYFEYILVDNCSTDRSGEIAETYALRDSRIRLIRRSQLLSQAQNYNSALTEISDSSKYCKVVQADDFIFPNCLESMVRAFEQSRSIGLVSSYWLRGNRVMGSDFPFSAPKHPGKEVALLLLRNGVFVFGSETTVMYRSSLVRSCQPFYGESLLHADTEKCLQILEQWDFGFVPQILSFNRVDNINESISSAVANFEPRILDRYISVQRFASAFLNASEASTLKSKTKREYYRVLARAAIRLRRSPFWQYHKLGLSTLGETLSWPRLAMHIVLESLWMAVNPGISLVHALRSLKRSWKRAPARAQGVLAGEANGERKTLLAGSPVEGVSSTRRVPDE